MSHLEDGEDIVSESSSQEEDEFIEDDEGEEALG